MRIFQPRPQSTPYDSPWGVRMRIVMQVWEYTWYLLCSWTPKPFNGWRLWILRLFGARLEGKPFVHGRARITIPWHLHMHDRACLGDRSHAYTLAPVVIEEGATVAQEAYLCTGTHDFVDPALPLVTQPITIGAHAFIGARAFIMPGVKVGARAVVGASSVVTKNVKPNAIMVGNPARLVGWRNPEGPTGG